MRMDKGLMCIHAFNFWNNMANMWVVMKNSLYFSMLPVFYVDLIFKGVLLPLMGKQMRTSLSKLNMFLKHTKSIHNKQKKNQSFFAKKRGGVLVIWLIVYVQKTHNLRVIIQISNNNFKMYEHWKTLNAFKKNAKCYNNGTGAWACVFWY